MHQDLIVRYTQSVTYTLRKIIEDLVDSIAPMLDYEAVVELPVESDLDQCCVVRLSWDLSVGRIDDSRKCFWDP